MHKFSEIVVQHGIESVLLLAIYLQHTRWHNFLVILLESPIEHFSAHIVEVVEAAT